MLTIISQHMIENDRFSLDIERVAKGFRVTVTPRLSDSTDEVPDEALNTRAALAMPLVVTGAAEEIEQVLSERFAGYAEARADLKSSYESLIESMREAAKEAREKAKPRKAASTHAGKPAKATVACEASCDDDLGGEAASATAAQGKVETGNAETITF
jgi:PRTRC genetic system protein E